jgi:hypothetical protein
MIEDDIHDQLTKAYLEYFKENEKFETRLSSRPYIASRRWLREIRKLAKLRQEEIYKTYAAKKEAVKKQAK